MYCKCCSDRIKEDNYLECQCCHTRICPSCEDTYGLMVEATELNGKDTKVYICDECISLGVKYINSHMAETVTKEKINKAISNFIQNYYDVETKIKEDNKNKSKNEMWMVYDFYDGIIECTSDYNEAFTAYKEAVNYYQHEADVTGEFLGDESIYLLKICNHTCLENVTKTYKDGKRMPLFDEEGNSYLELKETIY